MQHGAAGADDRYRARNFSFGRPAYAAQEPDSQENWHPNFADCFQVFGTDSERLLPTKLKVSFPTFPVSFIRIRCASGLGLKPVLAHSSPPNKAAGPAAESERDNLLSMVPRLLLFAGVPAFHSMLPLS